MYAVLNLFGASGAFFNNRFFRPPVVSSSSLAGALNSLESSAILCSHLVKGDLVLFVNWKAETPPRNDFMIHEQAPFLSSWLADSTKLQSSPGPSPDKNVTCIDSKILGSVIPDPTRPTSDPRPHTLLCADSQKIIQNSTNRMLLWTLSSIVSSFHNCVTCCRITYLEILTEIDRCQLCSELIHYLPHMELLRALKSMKNQLRNLPPQVGFPD